MLLGYCSTAPRCGSYPGYGFNKDAISIVDGKHSARQQIGAKKAPGDHHPSRPRYHTGWGLRRSLMVASCEAGGDSGVGPLG